MAAYASKTKEHAFITIEKDLKGGDVPNLVLLCGKEDYLIRWYTDALINRYVNETCRALDLTVLEEEISIEKISECLETVSLMSERKVVLLPDFPPAGGKKLKGFTENVLKEFTEYFSRIPDGALLLITVYDEEEQSNSKNKFRSAVEKYGKVYDFQPLKDRQLSGFIDKRLRSSGKSYRPSVINAIIELSGYGNKSIEYSLYNLDNDIKKIIAHSSMEEITVEDVRSVLSYNPENNVFAMLEAIGRNRKDEAFRLLNNLIEAGNPVYSLLRMIVNQLEIILSVKEMRNEGMNMETMQKKLGIHQFRIKKAMAVTGQYSEAQLKKALSHAYEIDGTIKSGLMEGPLALEFFISSL